MERSMLTHPSMHRGEIEVEVEIPVCDRCEIEMHPTGWVLQPNGRGGLRRITAYRCDGCGRLFDPYWGFRPVTGGL